MKWFDVMRYVAVFARYYFGIHCFTSGANYFLHFSRTGGMLDPVTVKFMEAITALGIYGGIKTLELVVGVCVLTGFMLPLALVLEFPVSVTILILALYQGVNIHLLTGAKEVVLNAFLLAVYAGYYVPILTAYPSHQRPIWDRSVWRTALGNLSVGKAREP